MGITLNPEARATEEGGQVESIYVVFRPGECAHETIPFLGRINDEDVELLIDVDRQDFPVAVQFVGTVEQSLLTAESPVSSGDSTFLTLFSLCLQMVTFHRADQHARGNALIRDALKSIRRHDLTAA